MKGSTLPWLCLGLLALVLAVELARPSWDGAGASRAPDAQEALARASTAPQPQALRPPFSLPLPDAFDEVAARPLFHRDRRPFVPEQAPAKVAPPPPAPDFSLLAVVRDGDRRLALVNPGRRAPAQALEVGEELQGWRVESIGRQRIELSRGEQRLELGLGPDAGSAASRPGAARRR